MGEHTPAYRKTIRQGTFYTLAVGALSFLTGCGNPLHAPTTYTTTHYPGKKTLEAVYDREPGKLQNPRNKKVFSRGTISYNTGTTEKPKDFPDSAPTTNTSIDNLVKTK